MRTVQRLEARSTPAWSLRKAAEGVLKDAQVAASPGEAARLLESGAAAPEMQRCCPHPLTRAPPQIVGSRLRIPQVTPADSGEYVCHVSNGGRSQETSLVVTIEGSGPSHGERAQGRGSRQVGAGGGRPGPGTITVG